MKTLRERLEAKLDKSNGHDRCWWWTASICGSGYGQIGRGCAGAGNLMSHRAAYIVFVGPIPDGMQVLHRCDNKLCCNPAHLFLGTQSDNIVDMDTKGRRRAGDTRGERGGLAKLTDARVLELRAMYAAKSHTQQQLAAQFGVRQSTVSSIVRRATWSHI